MNALRWIASAALVAASLAGCAGSVNPGKAPVLAVLGDSPVQRLFPAPQRAVMTYEMTGSPGNGRGKFVVEVTRTAEGLAWTTGQSRTTLVVTPTSVTSGDGKTVLGTRMNLGDSWDEGKGWTARVEAVDVSSATAAGTYQGCLQVSSSTQQQASRITTTYCPAIGRVAMVTETGPSNARRTVYYKLVSVAP